LTPNSGKNDTKQETGQVIISTVFTFKEKVKRLKIALVEAIMLLLWD
jgi:hypothetical protein